MSKMTSPKFLKNTLHPVKILPPFLFLNLRDFMVKQVTVECGSILRFDD
jgi:hypothetical protein